MQTEKTTTRLDFARQLIAMGIAIIPLHHRSKEPMLTSWRRYMNELPSDTEYSTWLASGWQNYGVVCGWQNLTVIDFDSIEIYELWKLWTQSQGIDTQYVVSRSFKVRTARGMHVYVTSWEAMQNQKRRGIDIQAQGKYVVGPMSVHPSGATYAPIGELVFPIVFDFDEILPLDLFPMVAHEAVEFKGQAPTFAPSTTEYQYDPFAAASMSSDVDLLVKVKSSVRLESLFAGLKKTSIDGRWLACQCPFHEDKHPSFWIDTARQLCGCNVCMMKPMDVINLYARMHNVSESAAVAAMAEELGVWK
jgi:hypothetical protein